MAETTMEARVRGPRAKYSQGVDVPVTITNGGEMLVTAGLPAKTEGVRLRDSWSMVIPTESQFAGVAAFPTTRAELVLYNGEPGGGQSYIIDTVGLVCTVSTAALSNATIIYQVNGTGITDEVLVLINSPVGDTYNGKATKDLATTAFVANKWTPLASGTQAATASIGFGIVAEVNGGIILRPGMALGVNAVVGTATGDYVMSISWQEAVLL